MRRLLISILTGALLVSFAACDDDGGGGGSIAAYCDVVRELEGVQDPTDEQLDDVRAAAPGEISDDVDTLINALANADTPEEEQALAGDPDIRAASERVNDFEEENCETDDTTDDTVDDADDTTDTTDDTDDTTDTTDDTDDTTETTDDDTTTTEDTF